MIAASEQLQATSLKDAVLVMRAAAAYSTAIKNISDMLRHGMQIEKSVENSDKELPELIVKELTSAEVEELRSEMVGEESEA